MMRFTSFIQFISLICLGFFTLSCSSHRDKKVLVFFQLERSLPTGIQVIRDIAKEQEFLVDTTSQPTTFTEDQLQAYSAVVFLNSPGDLLNVRQQTDFERYVQAGGGYVGVNPAIRVAYDWPWYENLVKPVETEVENPEYQGTPVELTAAKEKEGAGQAEGIRTWRRSISGGHAFLMAGEKVSAALSSAQEKEQLSEGLQYAIGDNHINYALAQSPKVPEDNRFIKHTLVPGPLDEPTELTVLPDGKVLFVQRKGAVKLYDPKAEAVKTIGQLKVHTKFEDGLMGLAKDPDFYRNHWVYMYYSPEGDEPVQHLSRFLLLNDSLIMSSEKLILKVPVQREECCHTGGSIAFGPDGNLFLSTGDDTNPFQSDGYAPIDERPGRAPFDAQGSSGNTKDLRGKILRINVQDDASYTIPDGNLFSKDGSVGRPEIYVMGCRNPYRINIDQKTGWLYWGDVGPDARVDNEQRGPRGYDAVKQARKAGFYGWPYFRGNRAYRDYNFATGESGDYFDAEGPVNDSPNNTGASVLPPFNKSFVWYPYDESPEFPIVKIGGRNAMAGPVFHYDMYRHAEKRFPRYYDGKLFMYDWMRNWIIAATTDEKGNLVRLEPFMDSTQFNKIIDMEMAHDGSIYILEYGSEWFAANPNASLSRIEYAEGNRSPLAKLTASQTVGAAPLTVKFSSEGTFDYDKEDKLQYEWFFTGEEAQSEEPNPSFTFEKPGTYEVKMRAYDQEGESDTEELTIKVGNDEPKIDIALASNSTFYWENEPIAYDITVSDKEDGSTANGGITAANVNFTFDYVADGANAAEELGHKSSANGLALIENSGCKACHAFDKTSVGPAYNDVAKRYGKADTTINRLVNKILKGGGGVWGDRAMPAQAVNQEEAEAIVNYIVTLDEKGESLPLKGSFKADKAGGGRYVLNVNYTDKGGQVIGPLSAQQTVSLRHPKVQAETNDVAEKAREIKPESGAVYMGNMKTGSYLAFDSLDLKNVSTLTLRVSATAPGFSVAVKADKPDGKTVASASIPATKGETDWKEVSLPVENASSGRHTLYFVVSRPEQAPEDAKVAIDWIYFNKGTKAGKKVAMQ